MIRRAHSDPASTRKVEYDVPTERLPQRSSSYHGLTECETQRSSTSTSKARQAIVEQPLPSDKDIAIDAESLKKRYLCREVAKSLKKREGFDRLYKEDKRTILCGGFQKQEARIIMAQPVTPLKLLLAQAEKRRTSNIW
jgi:hypothetical protein